MTHSTLDFEDGLSS